MSWINVNQQLPPIKTKVKVCNDSWVSEGWLLPSGTWSIKWKEGMPKFPILTHWQYLKIE